MSSQCTTSRTSKAFAISCLVGAIIPILVAFDFIHRYGYNSLLADDFGFIAPLADLLAGRLPLSDLLDQHNQHRSFFGKTVYLALGFATNFNSVAQMYLSWVFKVLTFVLVSLITIKAVGRNKLALVLCVFNSLVMFSLRNDRTFLIGLIFTNSMAVFFLVASIYFIGLAGDKDGARSVGWFLVAVACAVVSTFSANMVAIAIWPLGFVFLGYAAIVSRRGLLWYQLFLWIAFSIANMAAYFVNYTTTKWNYSKPSVETLMHYGTLITGGTIFGDEWLAITGGILLLCLAATGLFVITCQGFKLQLELRVMPSVCLFLFGLASIALITFGRAGGVPDLQALSSRYAQFGGTGLCGLFVVLAMILPGKAWFRHIITGLALTLALVGYVHCLALSAEVGTQLLDRKKQLGYILRTHAIQSDASLGKLGWGVPRRIAEVLDNAHVSVFADEQQRILDLPRVPLDRCFNVERFAQMKPGKPWTRGGARSTIEVHGWVYDPEQQAPGKAVFLKVKNFGEVPACYSMYRPDVAKTFARNSLTHSGFYASFNGKLLSPGTYPVSLLLKSADGQKVFETSPFGILEASADHAISFKR